MRAAIDWSYALLTERERTLLGRLSVFAGGCTADAVDSVCGEAAHSGEHLDALVGLVEKSLVMSDQRGSRVRYRLLETIRAYASERLEASGQSAEVQRRHATYFHSLAERGGTTRRGVRYAPDMDLVRSEHDNMRAALRALLRQGEVTTGLTFCEALSGFWLSQGYFNEGEEWLNRFLAETGSTTLETVAQGLYIAGRFAEYRGALESAQAYFSKSLRLGRDSGSFTHCARALFGLASVAAHQGDYSQAYGCFREGLSLGRDPFILADVSEALAALARIESLRGESISSRAHFEEAVAIQRQLGDSWGLAYVLNELGQQARDERDLERAQGLEEEAYTLWMQSGSRMGQRAALMNLAVISFERSDLGRARQLALQILNFRTLDSGLDASCPK
jgi:tetratricopeptide (TPR) repeat protein